MQTDSVDMNNFIDKNGRIKRVTYSTELLEEIKKTLDDKKLLYLLKPEEAKIEETGPMEKNNVNFRLENISNGHLETVLEISEELSIHLTKKIKQTYLDNEQDEKLKSEKLQTLASIETFLIKQGIQNEMKENGAKFHRIIPFGSTVTGLAAKSSDIDMCIAVEKGSVEKEKKPVTKKEKAAEKKRKRQDSIIVLSWVHKQLAQRYSYCEFIATAEVPIIRIKTETIDMDIAASVDAHPPPTFKLVQMINTLSKINKDFPILCGFVKNWFGSFGAKSKTGRFIPNSYKTVLIVIQFMQAKQLLPNLYRRYPDHFLPAGSKKPARWSPRNRPSAERESVCWNPGECPLTEQDHSVPAVPRWCQLVNWKHDSCPLTEKDIGRMKREVKIVMKEEPRNLGALFADFLKYYTSNVLLSEKTFFTDSGRVEEKHITDKNSIDPSLLIFDRYSSISGLRMDATIVFEKILKDALFLIKNNENVDDVMNQLWSIKVPELPPNEKKQNNKKQNSGLQPFEGSSTGFRRVSQSSDLPDPEKNVSSWDTYKTS